MGRAGVNPPSGNRRAEKGRGEGKRIQRRPMRQPTADAPGRSAFDALRPAGRTARPGLLITSTVAVLPRNVARPSNAPSPKQPTENVSPPHWDCQSGHQAGIAFQFRWYDRQQPVIPAPTRHSRALPSFPHPLVIPAPSRHSRALPSFPHPLVIPAPTRHSRTHSSFPHPLVIPAKAGIQTPVLPHAWHSRKSHLLPLPSLPFFSIDDHCPLHSSVTPR